MFKKKEVVDKYQRFLVLFKIYFAASILLIFIFNCLFFRGYQAQFHISYFNKNNNKHVLSTFKASNNCIPIITIGIALYNKISYLERLCLSILQYTNTERNSNRDLFEMIVIDANSNDASGVFFENLASIINKPFNLSDSLKINVHPDIMKKYNIEQFTVNSDIDFNSSFNLIPVINIPILKYDRSCIFIKVVKLNSTAFSNVARQIVVEQSTGKYIWQLDPDDMINTSFVSTIIKEINNHNNTDLFEFGFNEYVLKDGNLTKTIRVIMRNNIINSNFEIAKRFLQKSVYWQLWHLLVRREVYLKAVKTIRNYVPNQEEVVFASDLFHYAPIVYNSNSYFSFKGTGYFYFYMNKGSVSLDIAKGKTKTQQSGRIIYDFIASLFNNSGIPMRNSLKKIYM